MRKREDCSDTLSLLFFFTFTKHTHFQARSPMVHSHFAFSGAQLVALQRTQRQGVEAGRIEAEEEEEEVEEDVCDEERKRI